jgi:hypothetical protein
MADRDLNPCTLMSCPARNVDWWHCPGRINVPVVAAKSASLLAAETINPLAHCLSFDSEQDRRVFNAGVFEQLAN